jgi:hypothetical protein
MTAKAGHTNMMTDCIIANLPPEVLRSTIRGLLGGDPKLTSKFNSIVSSYLTSIQPATFPELFVNTDAGVKTLPAFKEQQSRYRCLMGCGRGFECLGVIGDVVTQLNNIRGEILSGRVKEEIGAVDGDIVQAVTSVQKELLARGETRAMEESELDVLLNLREKLRSCQDRMKGGELSFERAIQSVEMLLKSLSGEGDIVQSSHPPSTGFNSTVSRLESFKLGDAEVPRIFCGLWQFSSPAWGSASKEKIHAHFRKHIDAGLIAYGKFRIRNLSFNLVVRC